MVFFTCNHCGESLKKPAVEKHYQWKSCKDAPAFLTCVDCLKDFRGDEYKAHIKCVSELEKYSAKGFVAKPERNKGAQKQEAWTEALQSLQNKSSLDNYTKQILQRIASQDNVPRKEVKFINFIKSSMRMSPNNALKLWGIIQEAQDDFKKNMEAKKEIANKKRNHSAVLAEDVNEVTTKDEQNGHSNGALVKKKKTTSDNSESLETEEIHQISTSKSKKRSKNARDPSAEELIEIPNGNNVQQSDTIKKNKNKNKDKFQNAETISEDDNIASAKMNGNASADQLQEFDWKATILKIISKKQSIEMERLKEKVLKKYSTNIIGDKVDEKMEKKFRKHLKKLKNISTENGVNNRHTF